MPGPARLLPALPVLVRAVDDQRTTARSLLEAAARAEPGQAFTVAGVSLIRAVVARGARETIWADDPAPGKRRNLSREEDHAFIKDETAEAAAAHDEVLVLRERGGA